MTAQTFQDTEKIHKVDIAECEKPFLDSQYSTIFDRDEENEKIFFSILSLKHVDMFLSSTLICFLLVACWRGTWSLLDIYSEYFPICESFILSIFIYLVLGFSQTFFHNLIIERPAKNLLVKCFYYLVTKIYFLLVYLSTIMHWRSSWEFFSKFYGMLCIAGNKLNLWSIDSPIPAALVFIIVSLALIWIRGVNNVTATPLGISTDVKEETFLVEYRFLKMGERTSLYILDCLFSILIVGTLVVFVWRGVWLLLDLFLFPDNETFSSWSSLVLGYFIVAIAFLLQPVMRYFCERLTGTARLLVADLFILFALCGTVNVWRGIWNLLNIYFLPDNLELSCWITHWVSLIILILCRCSNSLLVRGVYIDAEEPAGKCVVFPCYYLRVIFRKKKLKKLNLTAFSLNDAIKANHKDIDNATNNHTVNVSTISNTVEENNDFKQSK